MADVALTKTELAKAVGISRQATTKHIARPGWPQSKTPPWSKAAYAGWHKMNIPPDNAEFYRADKANQAPEPEEQPSNTDDAFARVVAEIVNRYEEDPRYWLRAVLGIVIEIDEGGGPIIPEPKDYRTRSPAGKAEFHIGTIRKARAHRAKLKTLALATDEEVDDLISSPLPLSPTFLEERAEAWQTPVYGPDRDVARACIQEALQIPGQHNPVPRPFNLIRK